MKIRNPAAVIQVLWYGAAGFWDSVTLCDKLLLCCFFVFF